MLQFSIVVFWLTFAMNSKDVFDALASHYGLPAQEVLPEDLFERLIAVALDQALEARQIPLALDALRDAGLLTPENLADADPVEIADAWQPLAIRQPEKLAAPLRKLAKWIVDRHHGDMRLLLDVDVSTAKIRDELISLKGIGPATADSLLLHSLDRPSYPIDRATYRVLVRHGWVEPTADYEEARSVVEGLAHEDSSRLKQLSTWFARIGHDFCKVTVPKCDRCPLRGLLPTSGPIYPGA